MVSKVALIELKKDARSSLRQALNLIGKVDDLNTSRRAVVVKLGVFDHREKNHATVNVVIAIVKNFNRSPKILLAEADNYKGTGSERLQIWKGLFNERIVPFDLSEDTDTRELKVVDEVIPFSNAVFKPNALVSVHVLRDWEAGSALKNLLGLIPDRKKARFHRKGLAKALIDIYEGVGGIDLAVLDGTYSYLGKARVRTNLILVGRDAVAVDAVGGYLVGLNPGKMPVVQEAVRRGIGEGDMGKIEVVGCSLENAREKIDKLLEVHSKRDKRR